MSEWTINRLSSETGLDRRTIAKLLEGSTPCGQEGEYPLYRLTDLITALRERENKSGATTAIQKHRAKLLAAKARSAEVQAAIDENAVLFSDDVFQAWSEIIMLVRHRILTIPSRLPTHVINPEARKLIEQEIDDALLELSRPPEYPKASEQKGKNETDEETESTY